jgi:hypothetical protein
MTTRHVDAHAWHPTLALIKKAGGLFPDLSNVLGRANFVSKAHLAAVICRRGNGLLAVDQPTLAG